MPPLFAIRLLLGARKLLKRIPWQVWAGMALIGAALLYGHHKELRGYARAEVIWQAKAAKLEAERQAALVSEEEALRQIAKDTDNAVYQKREASRDRTEQFIRSGGVRGQACPVNRHPEDRSAGSGSPVHQAPVVDGADRLPETVSVLPDDVRICTNNTILAEELRAFVLGLEAK